MQREYRPYQQECLDIMRKQLPGNYLIQMATGLGKTYTFAGLEDIFKGRILILSHREELTKQPEKYFKSTFGREQGKIKSNNERIISGCVASMVNRLDRFNKDDFEIIIVDECFPAGTIIDGKCIENLHSGDIITSYNHNTNKLEKKKILRTFKSIPGQIVIVKLSNGKEIVCTGGHPFYTKQGYIPANKLINNYEVLCMRKGSTEKRKKTCTRLLFRQMFFNAFKCCYGKYKQKIFVGKDEETQSNEKTRNKGKSIKKIKGNWTLSKNKMWEWLWFNSATTKFINCIKKLKSIRRISNPNKNKKGKWISNLLQNRHSNYRTNDCYRNRRKQSLFVRKTKGRRKERQFFDWVRVESVKIQKQTSEGEFGGLCKDGYVYNIEVEDNNNYFVNNILVHNCHHTPTPTYKKILNYFEPKYVFGFTATPNRGDNIGLNDCYDEIIFNKSLRWGIENKYLCDVECKRVNIGYSLKNVKTTCGDYQQDQLNEAVNIEKANIAIGEAYKTLARGKTLIFCINVNHCYKIKEVIQGSEVVDGNTEEKERERILNKFQNGDLDCLINCMVLTEGTDIPNIQTIIFARPTKNDSLYIQAVGRGLRPAPGKEKLLLIDCVGVSEDLSLCSAPTLLGLKMDAVPKEKEKEIIGDLFGLEEKMIIAGDNPRSWIKNIKTVNLWSKGTNYNTHNVNYFKMPNGDFILNIPKIKFCIKKPDELGNTDYHGKLVPIQDIFDKAYKYLFEKHLEHRALWDINVMNKWGKKPATTTQKKAIQRQIKNFETESLTCLEASLILNRLYM